MTKERLKNEFPELYEEIFNEGVALERNKKNSKLDLLKIVKESKN